jgi:carbamoylphosphate synthase small subunit
MQTHPYAAPGMNTTSAFFDALEHVMRYNQSITFWAESNVMKG